MTNLNAERLCYLDGGMGTLLQGMGLRGGEGPESWNEKHPERVFSAHLAYLNAGADVIASNTFGATAAHLGDKADELMTRGVEIALEATREAGHGTVAVDMGSLGALLHPYGDLPFEETVSQFRRAFTRGIEAGGELILMETMTDQLEIKACVLGAKEAMRDCGKTLPLWCSMSFDTNGRLLTGADIEGVVAMLAGLRVDAIGLNCGHEPKALWPNVKRLCACSPLPVFVSPNASLPVVQDGQVSYPTTPEEFAADMRRIAELGAWGLGGCCGTTPEHIRQLVDATRGMRPVRREPLAGCVVSGRTGTLHLGGAPVLIGERLNPTGKPRMKQALREGDLDLLMAEAVSQLDAGTDALDVNVGLPEINEAEMLPRVVTAVQRVCDKPLQIDTADAAALEAALRVYSGKPVINSVSGKQSAMDAVFPLAARYGGAVVALLLDDDGIPDTVEKRLGVARRVIAEAAKYGIPKSELIFDALTLPVAADAQAANVTLETVRALTRELGVMSVLGASNVSFGLPQRSLVNAAFLAMAVREGLSAAIMNPQDALCRASFDAAAALCGREAGLDAYVAGYAGREKLALCEGDARASGATGGDVAGGLRGDGAHAGGIADSGLAGGMRNDGAHTGDIAPAPAAELAPFAALSAAVVRGLSGEAKAESERLLALQVAPMELVEKAVMPALAEVGRRFETGALFLPQLLQCASAAQSAFDAARARMPERPTAEGRKVVLATVWGDVHDIGKNIVKVLLQNYGFNVVDLGRDVPPETVLQAAKSSGASLVGLSALMTTTVPAMRDTIELLKRELPDVRVVVGGAVLTADYARRIGADDYAQDAMATVRVAQSVYPDEK